MGVIDQTYLPFKDLIVLIGSAYSNAWDQLKDRVIAYLWTICLVEDWDSATNDTTRKDFKELDDLLEGRLPGKAIVEKIEHHLPDFEEVLDAGSKANIIYRTLSV
jgi:hypothetical protein